MKRIFIWLLFFAFSIQFLCAKSSIYINDGEIIIECDYHNYNYRALGCLSLEDYKISPAKVIFNPLNKGGWMVTFLYEVWLYGQDCNVIRKDVEKQILFFPIDKTTIDIKEYEISLFNSDKKNSLILSVGTYNEIEIYAYDDSWDAEFCFWPEEGEGQIPEPFSPGPWPPGCR